MLPALTAKNSRGLPNVRQASQLRQSGWLTMPTRNPALSSSRPSKAMAKLGWSMYASPVMNTTSNSCQPRCRASSIDMGNGCAAPRGMGGAASTIGNGTSLEDIL